MLVRKFSAGILGKRRKLCGNCAFPENFLTRKLYEILVFYAVRSLNFCHFISPFQPSIALLYPLKTLENLSVFWCFQVVLQCNTGLKWVNQSQQLIIFLFRKFTQVYGLLNTWSYICHIWRPKLRGQFSENLVLWIYEFLFNSGDRISKEGRIIEIMRIKNLKYDRNFQLTNCFLINTLLFVRIKETSKNRSPGAAFQCVT